MTTFAAFQSVLPSFLNSNPKVDAATTDDDRPTPFHLYTELAQLTFQGANVCERLLQHLLVKLEGGSAAVKIKVLMIMAHLLEKGHQHFQRELQQKAEKIRPCLEFRGPPDPVLGDTPYRIVRERAQVVINGIYDTSRTYQPEQPVSVGIGSSSSPQGSQPAGVSRPYMQGFGNTPTNSTSGYGGVGPSDWSTTLKGQASGAGTAIATFLTSAAETVGTALGVKSEPQSNAYDPGRYLPPSNDGAIPAPHGNRSAYQQRPIVTTPSPFQKNHTMGTINPSYGETVPGVPGGGWSAISGESKSNQSNTPEQTLVEAICLPTGIKLQQPTRMQLSQFAAKVKESENAEYICYLLSMQLSDQDWKRRSRSLCCIHELITYKIPPTSHYFANDGLPSLLSLVTSPQKTVKDQALKIIAMVAPDSFSTPDQEEYSEPAQELQQNTIPDNSGTIFDLLPNPSLQSLPQTSAEPSSTGLFGVLHVSEQTPPPQSIPAASASGPQRRESKSADQLASIDLAAGNQSPVVAPIYDFNTQSYTYPEGFAPPSQNLAAKKTGPETPVKKDPFDFGDLKNIDATL